MSAATTKRKREFSSPPPPLLNGDSFDFSLLEAVEKSQKENTVEALDIRTLKKLVLAFERRYKENIEARLKYPDQPDRFADSELELHQELQKLKILAGGPELYPELVNLNIPINKKNKKERYQEELEERIVSLIASLFGGILRGSRRERLLSKFVENECEKIDRLMELYLRYSDRVKAETERMDQLDLDDLEMDEEERYNQKLESGLYTLQLIAVILGHLWCSEHHLMRARIELLLKQHKLTRKDVKDILQVLAVLLKAHLRRKALEAQASSP